VCRYLCSPSGCTCALYVRDILSYKGCGIIGKTPLAITNLQTVRKNTKVRTVRSKIERECSKWRNGLAGKETLFTSRRFVASVGRRKATEKIFNDDRVRRHTEIVYPKADCNCQLFCVAFSRP
jgi:hypothetical protein